jgi:hypothetical protein
MRKANADMSDWTKVHKAAAEPVGVAAVRMAPRDSGKLAGSHKTKATRTQAKVTAGSASVPYAGPIHFGWPGHNIEPQPWLTSALELQWDAAVRVYENEVERIIHKIDLAG